MKPNHEQVVNNQFSSHGRAQQMTFDPNSLAHIQRVLINLYSDPLMAVVREYSTNAYDSHVAAGKAEVPFHVTIPSAFSSDFVIRDFGVGLSEDEVFDVFGAYGASTKRESDDFVGQLGLGCKSALAVTNQFSLTTIQGGTKWIFSVHLDEYGVGKITKLHEEESTEETGVEVSIPIRDYRAFNLKVRRFFRTFPVFPVFTDNSIKEEDLKMEVVLEIDDATSVVKSTYDDNGQDYIIMGGVAYPYRSQFRPGGDVILVTQAKIGQVDFTPSREELQMTARTKNFLATQAEKVKEQTKARILEESKKCKTLLEYHSFISKNHGMLASVGITKLSFNGRDIDVNHPNTVITEGFEFSVLKLETYYNNALRRGESSAGYVVFEKDENYYYGSQPKGARISLSNLENVVVIDGVANGSLTTYTRGRLRMFMTQRGLTRVLVTTDLNNLDADYRSLVGEILTIDDVKKEANSYLSATRKATVKQNLYNRVRIVRNYGYKSKLETSRVTPDVNVPTIYGNRSVVTALYKSIEGEINNKTIELFILSDKQEKKFLEFNDDAVRIEDYLVEKIEHDLSTIPASDVLTAAFYDKHSYGSPVYNGVTLIPDFRSLDQIEDVTLRDFLVVALSVKSGYSTAMREKISRLRERVHTIISAEGSKYDRLTLLIQRIDSIGQTELKEFIDEYNRLRKVYPILLEPKMNSEYLIQYVNLVSKGEQ